MADKLQKTITEYLKNSSVFEQKIIDCFCNCEPSSHNENYQKGFDFSINVKFDIKRAKKINRTDNNVNYDLTWLEYKDINGNYGQLFKQDLDYFFYEREDFFDVRSRLDALKLFKQSCYYIVNDEKVKKEVLIKNYLLTDVKPYQPYTREGRKDIIMLVEFSNDLWKPHFIIPKSELNL